MDLLRDPFFSTDGRLLRNSQIKEFHRSELVTDLPM